MIKGHSERSTAIGLHEMEFFIENYKYRDEVSTVHSLLSYFLFNIKRMIKRNIQEE